MFLRTKRKYYILSLKKKDSFIYFRERERACMHVSSAGRRRGREYPSRLCTE